MMFKPLMYSSKLPPMPSRPPSIIMKMSFLLGFACCLFAGMKREMIQKPKAMTVQRINTRP
ncbi:MAG: hypothetical protein ACLU4J_22175 [Butyricimonas paravirosa]